MAKQPEVIAEINRYHHVFVLVSITGTGTAPMDERQKQSVNEDVYDENYFLKDCGGADWLKRFTETKGKVAYPYYGKLISRIGAQPGQHVLDIGCGRGEMTAMLSLSGMHCVGMDYSSSALRIAKEVHNILLTKNTAGLTLVKGTATQLPFPSQSFDRILMADIVEHLHKWQLSLLYDECYRVLKTDGKVLIHTWPNVWHTKYTYPTIARISNLLGKPRPLDHRKPHDRIMHVNEQSLFSLRRGLTGARFTIERTWCEHETAFS